MSDNDIMLQIELDCGKKVVFVNDPYPLSICDGQFFCTFVEKNYDSYLQDRNFREKEAKK